LTFSGPARLHGPYGAVLHALILWQHPDAAISLVLQDAPQRRRFFHHVIVVNIGMSGALRHCLISLTRDFVPSAWGATVHVLDWPRSSHHGHVVTLISFLSAILPAISIAEMRECGGDFLDENNAAPLPHLRGRDGRVEPRAAHHAWKSREAGYRRLDAYAPFPVEVSRKRSVSSATMVPYLSPWRAWLAVLAFFLQLGVGDSPIDQIGGRPLNSWPAFIP